MPLHDTGALTNPLVARVDHALEIFVREDFLGQIATRARDARVDGHALAEIFRRRLTRCSMRPATSAMTSFLAIAIAFSNAILSAPP